MSEDQLKKARQLANKKYYQKIKDLRKKLTDFENEKDPDKKDADFFFAKNQPAQQTQIPPQAIILQAPPGPSLKNKILEGLAMSMIPLVPILLKYLISRPQRENNSSAESSSMSNTQSQDTNYYSF